MSKKLELIWKFLQAARRLIKNKDIKKDGILILLRHNQNRLILERL